MSEPIPSTKPSTATEWLLACLTDNDRATAILGDLTEMAATRGRLWFAAAYLRSLISLTWRTPVAFVLGVASLAALYRLNGFYFRHIPFAWWIHPSHPYIRQAVFYLAVQLWFLVPFAVVRYGFADRLVRVGLTLLLFTTGAELSIPLLSPFLAYTALRRPAITLVATSVVGAFTLLNLGFLAHMACWIDERKPLNASSHYRFFETGFAFPHTLFWVVVWSMGLLDMLVLAFVCSRLHRRLVRQRPAIA